MSRTRIQTQPQPKPDWLPPAEIVPADRAGEFPRVWRVASRHAKQLGLGVAWEFELVLEYRTPTHSMDQATTWAIGGAGHADPDLALKQLRQEAKAWGGSRIRIYDMRAPLTPEKRAWIRRANQVIRRPDYRLGKVAI